MNTDFLRKKRIAPALIAILALAAALAFGDDIAAWVREQTKPRVAAKPVAVEMKAPLRPLRELIPVCQDKGPGFQACMFDAGYAVNPDWTAAHKEDAPKAGGYTPIGKIDAVRDRFREGPSEAYGVPYWVPREVASKTKR